MAKFIGVTLPVKALCVSDCECLTGYTVFLYIPLMSLVCVSNVSYLCVFVLKGFLFVQHMLEGT